MRHHGNKNVTLAEKRQMQRLRLRGWILSRIANEVERSVYCVYMNTLGIDCKTRHNKVASISRRTGKAWNWSRALRLLRKAA